MSLTDSQKEILADLGEVLLQQSLAYTKAWLNARKIAASFGATDDEMDQAFGRQRRIVHRED